MHSIHTLTPDIDQRIRKALTARAVNMNEPRVLAHQVLQLSDFYLEHPGKPTPWDEPFAVPAYLAYFLPLNFARLAAVFHEVKRFLPPSSFLTVCDYGSGLGTAQWVLEEHFEPRVLFAIESSKRARELNAELLESFPARWRPEFREPAQVPEHTLGIFSYSFLEMQRHLPKLENFSHLLIVEPSTRECGRALMEWRGKLMGMGFTPLAPCTHTQECPLLIHSQRDWCHHRIHFQGPEWFEKLENHLPMKNRTLTYSYLLMSREVADEKWRGLARAIGDTIPENGKTRQMICRGNKREFLSWLHKHGEPDQIPHGALVHGAESCQVKGSELRVNPGRLRWEL